MPCVRSDLTFKLILAGNSEVGKSCLLTRFVVSILACIIKMIFDGRLLLVNLLYSIVIAQEDRYADMHVSTIGVDFVRTHVAHVPLS